MFKILVIIFYIFTCYETYYFSKAEILFMRGEAYERLCRRTNKLHDCYNASLYMQEAVKVNDREYYYSYKLGVALIKMYDITKNTKFFPLIKFHLERSKRNAWDKHYPHVGLAFLAVRQGKRIEALRQINTALEYIPNNKILLGMRGELQ